MVKVVIDNTKGLVQSSGAGVTISADSPLTIAAAYSAAATTTGTLSGQLNTSHVIFASGSAGSGPNPKLHQQSPNTLADSTAVLTAAAISHGVCVVTPTAARTKATATATALNNGLKLNANFDSYDFHVLNIATGGSLNVTFTGGASVTTVGNMIVAPNLPAIVSGSSVASAASAHFRYQRISATAGALYRLG